MNKRRKLFVSIICVLLALLMALSLILSAIPALAVSQTEIDELQLQREALAVQAQEQQALIDELDGSRALFLDRKLALDQQIELNQKDIALITTQIELYDAMIGEKEQELTAALAAETAQSEQLRTRMRAMEENGSLSYASFLFEASSLTDLLSRASDISDIMEHDQRLEADYMAAREDVEGIKADYEAIRAEQRAIKKELDNKRAQLDSQVTAACSMIANLDVLSDDAAADYAAIAADEERIERELDELMRQLAAQEAAAAAAAAAAWRAANPVAAATGTTTGITAGATTGTATGTTTGGTTGTATGTTTVGSGGFIWPTDSTYISSNFGLRDAPTAGATSDHQGLDIGAAAGTPIYAAASGTVELSGANGGYGNCVFINHGGGTATLYAHMSDMAVSSGQYVTQGQVIGYVGSTGIATGPHLHYEVRSDGQQVNPASYY